MGSSQFDGPHAVGYCWPFTQVSACAHIWSRLQAPDSPPGEPGSVVAGASPGPDGRSGGLGAGAGDAAHATFTNDTKRAQTIRTFTSTSGIGRYSESGPEPAPAARARDSLVQSALRKPCARPGALRMIGARVSGYVSWPRGPHEDHTRER